MFLFTKKTFMADALEGMVDYHNHLLPGIDDGSESMETTVAMINAYRELGFKGAYTTPHTMEDYYGNDAKKIVAVFHETRTELTPTNADFLIGTASEYMLDGGFPKILADENYLTLPENQLLFEFSYFQKPANAEELIFEMLNKDLTPILAHPERYRYLSIPEILELKNRGCVLQLNLLSLTGHYGNDAKTKAEALLKTGAYSLAATDAHKVDHLIKIKETKVPTKIYDPLHSLIKVL